MVRSLRRQINIKNGMVIKMSVESCLKQSKNRTSFICYRSAEIRKELGLEQHDAMIKAHEEFKEIRK